MRRTVSTCPDRTPDRTATRLIPGKLPFPPLVLFVAALAVYSATFGFELLATWDDKLYLIRNETITAFTAAHIKEAFTNYYLGNYAPLHIVSYMLDHHIWGLNPAGYHAENVLFHGLNGVLVYLFLRRIDASRIYAAIAAWIFLFHPVQVETVAWVSQRKNLLAMFFFLLALLSYQAYRRRTGKRTRAYLLALCWTTAAVLCKSVAVIIPVMLTLYDLTLAGERRPIRSLLPDKAPFAIIAAGAAIMAILSQSPEYGGGRRDYYGGSPLATAYTMAPVLVSYLGDCLWPQDLIPFYYLIGIRTKPDMTFIASALVLALVAGCGVWLHRHGKTMLFWYGLFFIALVPVMQIVPLVTLKHDRYLYFPMLGFAVLATGLARHAVLKSPPRLRYAVTGLGAIVLVLLPVAAFRQSLHWRNDITLWNRAVAVEPENRLGWRLLSMAYTQRGDAANAGNALNRYLELSTGSGDAHHYETQH